MPNDIARSISNVIYEEREETRICVCVCVCFWKIRDNLTLLGRDLNGMHECR